MEVLIVGAHGQIAQQLARRLLRRGDGVRGVIRKPEYAEELQEAGVQPVIVDLESPEAESELTHAAHGVDAIVFAAGAGPNSGPDRKWSVDHLGAVHSAVAAARADVPRIVILSSMGTDDPPQDDSVFSIYLRAKAQADVHVRGSALGHTIVRPGALTNEPPTGRVKAARHVERGEITRADVAAVLDAVLHDESAVGRTFEVVGSDTLVEDAVAALADQHDTLD